MVLGFHHYARRADIQLLKADKEQAVKDKEEAEKCAEKVEKDLHSLEERRERLQPVMDNVSEEIKEYGTVKTLFQKLVHWNVQQLTEIRK